MFVVSDSMHISFPTLKVTCVLRLVTEYITWATISQPKEEEVGFGEAADVESLLNPVVEFPVLRGRSMPSLEVFEKCVDVVLRNMV